MIIKNHKSISSKKSAAKMLKGLLATLTLFVLVAIGYFYFPAKAVAIKVTPLKLLADAEQKEGKSFVLNGIKTGGGAFQSKEAKYKGEYSAKSFAPSNVYCFAHVLNDVKVGETITVEVWVKNNPKEKGCLVLTSLDKAAAFYKQSCVGIETQGDWDKLQIVAKVDKAVLNNKLKIFCYNNTKIPVYFDNLSYSKSNQDIVVSTWTPDKIHLVIKEGEFIRLKKKRREALQEGMLVTSSDSWVKGAIHPANQNEDKTKVSLRLKGDWLDHLRGDKWSFRVKTEPAKSWNRLKVFSLQDPYTRSYLKEWVLHKLFKYEDILTTRYEFVNLVLNNEKKGLYVCEEHFTKQIPEYNLKREGPIIKFTEGGFWDSIREGRKYQKNVYGPLPGKANPDIRPFNEKKTKGSETLAKQFAIAQNLLYQYQYGLKPFRDIFDLDILAKYYAITDITGGHHGLTWHNQRFYYNPVTSKLEPVGYDGYDETGKSHLTTPFKGAYLTSITGSRAWNKKLFMDKEFVAKYMFYLNEFSKKEYIQAFMKSIEKELTDRKIYIKSQIPTYEYTDAYLYKRAQNIRKHIVPNSHSLHTRTLEKGKVVFCNKDKIALEVMGYASKEEGTITYFDSTLMIPSTPYGVVPQYGELAKVGDDAKYIAYRVAGIDKMYYVEINPWPAPIKELPAQKLKANLSENDSLYFYDAANKKVVFAGNITLDRSIVIPEGHEVVFQEGFRMDMIKEAYILSYSAVQFLGMEENPILVESTDNSANGIVVLKAKEKSLVSFTTFSGMNTFSFEGWNLTGAVTFYESDVDVVNSVFTKNICEDALNIVRSKFLFKESTVSHTFGDGFDADFCTGVVDKGYFYKTGNDGIDFSTSNITIKNTQIIEAGDKGISIGEQGTSFIKNTIIDGAVIGIASKDLSKVTVNGVTLKNCGQGFAAYQKKPEYGGGKIIVNSYKAENVKFLHKIFPGSYLKLIDKEIKGD